MEQQFPLAVQVAIYAAVGSVMLLTAVLIRVLLRVERQLRQVVATVERFEAELTPLARETRVVVDRLGDLTEQAHQVADAADGLLLSPLRTFNRTAQLARMAAITFLRALWTGRGPTEQKARTS